MYKVKINDIEVDIDRESSFPNGIEKIEFNFENGPSAENGIIEKIVEVQCMNMVKLVLAILKKQKVSSVISTIITKLEEVLMWISKMS